MKLSEINKSTIERIYAGFKAAYGFPQGECEKLARSIQKEIGGEVVAGFLKFNGGDREHWWVNKDGEIVDPMSDELMKSDPHHHLEVHRNTDLNKPERSTLEEFRENVIKKIPLVIDFDKVEG